MRKAAVTFGLAAMAGLCLLLMIPADLWAQGGMIQPGVDAARRGQPESARPQPAGSDPDTPLNLAQKPGKKLSTGPTTFTNNDRHFSFTLPAGWEQLGGDVNSEEGAVFGKPGTTMSFVIHFTQLVPSFPAQAAVDAALNTAKEEMTIGKVMSAQRRDDPPGPKPLVIGWEIVQARKGGSGSHQSIIWQCYDRENYYYSFIVTSRPDQFDANRAEMEGIINSVRFGR